MARTARQIRILVICALLSGCVSAVPPLPPAAAPPGPGAQGAARLENVMGRTAAALAGRFGTPALDVREGSARKLQFSNAVCVLDAYLYPRAGGGEAVVTHVDARLADGRDLDRASCIASFGR